MHLWSFEGFEDTFQKLFNEDISLLLQNITIFYQYINEKSAFELSERFVEEVLNFHQDCEEDSTTFLRRGGGYQMKEQLIESSESDEDENSFIEPESNINQGRLLGNWTEFEEVGSGEVKERRSNLQDWADFG